VNGIAEVSEKLILLNRLLVAGRAHEQVMQAARRAIGCG
jgi:hypothetical protein